MSMKIVLGKIDPLHALLQRYQAERKAFDDPEDTGNTDQDWDRIARVTWWRTLNKIIQSEPRVTTAAGALFALDHVLEADEFAERTESSDLQLLWLLVKAARDYIASMEMRDSSGAGTRPSSRGHSLTE
jgi:hypothetical protein